MTLTVATPASAPPPPDEHRAKARENKWYYVDLDDPNVEIGEDVLALMEARTARLYNVIPVQLVPGKSVKVAVENPSDLALAQSLRPLFDGLTMHLVYANPAAIRRKVEKVYSATVEASRLARQRDATEFQEVASGGDIGRIESAVAGSNVQLLRLIIEQALRDKASDIHIEPIEGELKVRFRVDGVARVAGRYPASRAEGLITLIKVEAQMTGDSPFMPDSGVLIFKQKGHKDVDIRVETVPTAWGTSAVLRLQSDIWRDLSTLGFSEANEKAFRKVISQPYGIVLLTGPTGSGKSTTLYSALRERISDEKKIITLENPIEYKAPDGITQIQINPKQDLSFPEGLRSILRQDPDIILVGEIRDRETAETAVDAAMTGHLLLSTLHANDAPGAIPRLTRWDIEPFLLSSALLCVVAQRLVRRLCPSCKITTAPDVAQIAEWGFPIDALPETLFTNSPTGCNDCRRSGFAGRVAIHEVMLVNDQMREAIAQRAPDSVVEAAARAAGMTSMREDGFEKALLGLTTLAEINANTRRNLV